MKSEIREMYHNAKQKLSNQETKVDEASKEEERSETKSSLPKRHSQGLDSLFEPTDKKPERVMADSGEDLEETTSSKEIPVVDFDSRTQSRISIENDQLDVKNLGAQETNEMKPISNESEEAHDGVVSRQVVVIDPENMEEAQVVTQSLKRGDCVIIDLRKTDRALGCRFLDFSFGATSALKGAVDVIEDKVYAITVGKAITQTEINRVKADGLL